MKNGVFWVVTPCGSCKNRRFGGTWRLLQKTPFFIVTAVKTSNLTKLLPVDVRSIKQMDGGF
jgi:hypothetical protein